MQDMNTASMDPNRAGGADTAVSPLRLIKTAYQTKRHTEKIPAHSVKGPNIGSSHPHNNAKKIASNYIF